VSGVDVNDAFFQNSGSWSAACVFFGVENHIVSANRKKSSQLISLNSLLPCLHVS